jgi:hypothetical protein
MLTHGHVVPDGALCACIINGVPRVADGGAHFYIHTAKFPGKVDLAHLGGQKPKGKLDVYLMVMTTEHPPPPAVYTEFLTLMTFMTNNDIYLIYNRQRKPKS